MVINFDLLKFNKANPTKKNQKKITLSFCVEVHQLYSDLSNSNSILMYPRNIGFR